MSNGGFILIFFPSLLELDWIGLRVHQLSSCLSVFVAVVDFLAVTLFPEINEN